MQSLHLKQVVRFIEMKKSCVYVTSIHKLQVITELPHPDRLKSRISRKDYSYLYLKSP